MYKNKITRLSNNTGNKLDMLTKRDHLPMNVHYRTSHGGECNLRLLCGAWNDPMCTGTQRVDTLTKS